MADAVVRRQRTGTAAEAAVAVLEANGVDTVFGIPGTHNVPLYRALGATSIRHVAMRHEQGLAYAADGYARRSGRPGVVITTTGPALLNAATGLAQAWSDSVPVLAISPGMPRRHPATSSGFLHELPDTVQAMRGAVGRSLRVETHQDLVRQLTDAFAAFRASRPRPAHLEVPLDLLDEEGHFAVPPAPAAMRRRPDEAALAEATRLLAEAQRPLVLAGGGAHGATGELLRLAERLGAYVLTTVNGKGAMPEDHPLALGAIVHVPQAHALIARADVVLAVGTEIAESDTWDHCRRWAAD